MQKLRQTPSRPSIRWAGLYDDLYVHVNGGMGLGEWLARRHGPSSTATGSTHFPTLKNNGQETLPAMGLHTACRPICLVTYCDISGIHRLSATNWRKPRLPWMWRPGAGVCQTDDRPGDGLGRNGAEIGQPTDEQGFSTGAILLHDCFHRPAFCTFAQNQPRSDDVESFEAQVSYRASPPLPSRGNRRRQPSGSEPTAVTRMAWPAPALCAACRNDWTASWSTNRNASRLPALAMVVPRRRSRFLLWGAAAATQSRPAAP
jgi:hypothetical protein